MLMPNIGALLKQEIARLSRRETRAQVHTTKKASAQHRRDIAALKREVETLKRQVALLQRQTLKASPVAAAETGTRKLRFVAKGLRSQRKRLGISAEDYGRLVGVSAQSIYNWERGHVTPRAEQVTALASLRGVTKQMAGARLAQLGRKTARKSRKQ
ncbi:MAG TPA: helix-turn-helix transcriptional regulator [Casimicrobiaceae bacterium]|nr:helix-turn-helix transcriptional regulator [Casimicrobiaceae bacterium]